MKEKIKNLIWKKGKEVGFEIEKGEIEVEIPKNEFFGDYSSNIALKLGKALKKNPMEVGKILIQNLQSPLFEKIELKEPGFINFFLSKKILFDEMKKIIKEKESYPRLKIGKKKKVIVDFSSPNIAKRFGVSHLRSTIIGEAISRIFQFLGFEVIKINHLGDWGTQFGNLIYQIKKEKKDPKKLDIFELEKLYVKFHKELEKNPELEEEGRKWFKKLEEGDKEAKKIWKICVKKSLKEFERIYKILGIKFDFVLGESFFEKMAKKLIKNLEKKKIAKESEGAKILEFENLPAVILEKSDKTTTYFARDLATLFWRIKKFSPSLILYVVGTEQSLHFQQLFETAKILHLTKKTKLFHLAHGLYLFEGKKFSTRKGKTIHFEDILKEGIEKTKKIIETSKTKKYSKREKEKIAKILTLGAIKYNDLKQHPKTNISFDWEKILNLKGNSGPYLVYTYVRAKSVFEKGKKKVKFNFKNLELEKEELEILREFLKFKDTIENAVNSFSPNLICDYLFNLAKKYNLFYEKFPILKEKEPKRSFRLLLSLSVSQIIKNGLSLLGIEVVEKM